MPTFAALAAALPYGWSLNYHLKVEGISTLFCERIYDQAAPSGYTLDESLVVDDGSAIGSIVDRQANDNIGRGFSFVARFLDTTAVRSLFTAPTWASPLTADATKTDTSIQVLSGSDLAPGSKLYLGREVFTSWSRSDGISPNTLSGLTRGTFSRARSHKAGHAVASDAPEFWAGRQCWAYVVAIDPYGNALYTTHALDQAAMVWTGFIAEQPYRDNALWVLTASSIEERLRSPLAAGFGGKAKWDVFGDFMVPFRLDQGYRIRMDIWDTTGAADILTLENRSFQPFASITNYQTLADGTTMCWGSQLRAAFKDWWDTRTSPHAQVGDLKWIRSESEQGLQWGATIEARVGAFTDWLYVAAGPLDSDWNYLGPGPQPHIFASPGDADGSWTGGGESWTTDLPYGGSVLGPARTPLVAAAGITAVQLEIELDDADPADIPSSGWVRVTWNEQVEIYRYSSVAIPDGADTRVVLYFDSGGPNVAELSARLINAEEPEISCEIFYRDEGSFPDLMRRMIASGGDGNNGTYDSLELDQGYDLAELDEVSFDTVFDGAFQSLAATLGVDIDASFADLFGGILALSQRGIVARPNAAGTDIEIVAVHCSHASTGVAVATITDADLVFTGGEPAVKSIRSRPTPRGIHLTVTRPGDTEEASVIVTDRRRAAALGALVWDLSIPGVARSEIEEPALGWALDLFRSASTEQVLELRVLPDIAVRVGEVVSLALEDPRAWQYSTGTPGYTGFGLTLGQRVDPSTSVQILTLLVDGRSVGRPLAPSAPVIGYTGSSTAPTTIKLDPEYYEIFAAFVVTGSTFKVLMVDAGTDRYEQGYQISAVTDQTTYTELTVDSVIGAPDLARVAMFNDGAEGSWWNFRQRYDDDFDWGRHTLTTPTAGTGPAAASAGTYYLYTEASGSNFPTKTATIEYLEAVLGDVGNPTIEFELHMYTSGTDASMGYLYLEVRTDEETDAWDVLDTVYGDQTNAWISQVVSLEGYRSLLCKLRLRAVTGDAETGDRAIDEWQILYHPQRITLPMRPDCNAAQLRYLHNDTPGGRWM